MKYKVCTNLPMQGVYPCRWRHTWTGYVFGQCCIVTILKGTFLTPVHNFYLFALHLDLYLLWFSFLKSGGSGMHNDVQMWHGYGRDMTWTWILHIWSELLTWYVAHFEVSMHEGMQQRNGYCKSILQSSVWGLDFSVDSWEWNNGSACASAWLSDGLDTSKW